MTTLAEYTAMPLPSLPEDTLVAAHGGLPTARAERCACGSVIVAMDDERAITAAVRAHMETPWHHAWRDREGF